ncbi:MAG TPA: transcriptional repressor [Nitrospinaceae bacterium]|jgi:Fe2+ or Zn2+ uptake regulation protein|nr:transcriptional repressor [Nitrospinaceae bacterium]|tara:strand:+ start:917 stop:1342 length:426 start_codon:yes stop_codon:yes gene_type:complete
MNNQKNSCPSDEELGQILKNAGLSITSPRLSLCRYILFNSKHPSIESVKDWAHKTKLKVSRATIYNTINALSEANLVKDLRFPQIDNVCYDNNVAHHHHFLDQRNGKIYDIDPQEFEVHSKLSSKFEVDGVDILIRGRIKK